METPCSSRLTAASLNSLVNILLDNPMTQFSFEWISSLNWLCQKWGQVHTTVRRLVSPTDIGGLSVTELEAYIRSLATEPKFGYLNNLNVTERLRIGDACDRIPLAIRWVFSRAKG